MITTTGVVLIAFGIYKVVTRHEKTEEEIRYLSFYDPLTGLYNRRYFENEMKRLNYSRDLPIGIVMADVDGFKSVNDTFGHKEGDRLLQDTAKTLRSVTRKGDILTRIGSMSRGR
ncbi:GGDEF domain-containing protein [Candidatus Aerophobetes bacterium]|uniref:GGDEF domain-containing protein n=1 Tax=Aerophobetes bacterium TaxID=2030807 RepID=A0A523QLL9_UNCAE|nr:MAG: GGDEF domain-containing protein [Candidatus Aerophobetes bacterium]